MALQKKEQTENQKKPENYFSVDQKKKENNQTSPLIYHKKNIGKKNFGHFF